MSDPFAVVLEQPGGQGGIAHPIATEVHKLSAVSDKAGSSVAGCPFSGAGHLVRIHL